MPSFHLNTLYAVELGLFCVVLAAGFNTVWSVIAAGVAFALMAGVFLGFIPIKATDDDA